MGRGDGQAGGGAGHRGARGPRRRGRSVGRKGYRSEWRRGLAKVSRASQCKNKEATDRRSVGGGKLGIDWIDGISIGSAK